MSYSSAVAQNGCQQKLDGLVKIYTEMSDALAHLEFGEPVSHVYNPLQYAAEPIRKYLELACRGRNRVVLLGMNPGPWGMAQTGVPFGTVNMVTEWLRIDGRVGKPAVEHPKRPVLGFEVKREEVSGTRFWGWAKSRYGTPGRFFDQFFVANYCPLVFMELSGRNRTPDKLPASEKKRLFEICDQALNKVVSLLAPEMIIGIGKFAEDRAHASIKQPGVRLGRILHPSPASPIANRGWAAQAEHQLIELGVTFPG